LRIGYHNFWVRVLDIIGAIVGLLLSLIPVLIIAIRIKREDGGPIFFKQKRVGKNGDVFLMCKIRSMVVEAETLRQELLDESDVDGMFKMKDDPRVTKVGKYIRKHSLDELPQFWNVLKGDMSLVGPRPALTEEADFYSDREKLRLKVKPGITGLWQVSGRSNVSFDKMIDLDLDYIENKSFLGDIRIMLKTLLLVFPGEKNGAY